MIILFLVGAGVGVEAVRHLGQLGGPVQEYEHASLAPVIAAYQWLVFAAAVFAAVVVFAAVIHAYSLDMSLLE